MEPERVRWAIASSGKWHAFREDDARSVCTLVGRRAVTPAPEQEGTVRHRCYWCRRELGLAVRPSRHHPPPRLTPTLVEFVGGRLDGSRIALLVEDEGPDSFRVVGQRFHRRAVPSDEEEMRTY